MDDLNKCLALGKNSGDIYYARGVEYICLNKFPLGCEDFEKALQLGYKEAQGKIDEYCRKN